MPISKPPPPLAREWVYAALSLQCATPASLPLLLLQHLFFFCSFLCCRQLLLSTAPKFTLRSWASVPVRVEKNFFLIRLFFPPETFINLAFFFFPPHIPLPPPSLPSVSHFSLFLSHFHRLYLSFWSLTLSSFLFSVYRSCLILPARHCFMVVKHLNPRGGEEKK